MIEGILKKATGGLDGLVDELIKAASDKIKEKISEAFSIRKLESLKENIGRVGRVKTILDPDSIVDLEKIFFEKAVTFTDGTKIQTSGFFSSKHVLIEGGPGQGKSLYLRWLCLNEGRGSAYIPIFIEFRNLKYKGSLKNDLFDAIRDFGIDLNDDLFDFLAKSEKLVFILDGFDEVPNSERLRYARELETIARSFPELRIVISSRPDSGMGASVYFEKYKISILSSECQKELINHIYYGGDEAIAINDILSTNGFLTEVTNTPLLLTLFAITYNARQFKPDSLAEFYNLIFPTMLYRHDRLKVGYERERKSGLTDYQMQRMFEALSFVSLKDNKTRFSAPLFRLYLEKTSSLERIGENLEDLLIDDITNITALIIKDGYDSYSFAHKSIQEYFSSVFLSRLRDERKRTFYGLVIKDFNEYRKWQNTLAFLGVIDQTDYTKYFLLPFKKNALNLNATGKVIISYKSLINMIGIDTKVEVTEDGALINFFWGDTIYSSIFGEYSDFIRTEVRKFLSRNENEIADYLCFCNEKDYASYQHDNGNFVLTLNHFFCFQEIGKEVCDHLSLSLSRSHFLKDLAETENMLALSEKSADEILKF